MKNPLVSVIIPFLNAERFLRESVESVFAQSYDQWELFLVDDSSNDGSAEIARSYAIRNPDRVFYVEHPLRQNRGISASRNLGIGQAKGDYVAFLDADDVWFPHKLERQIAVMNVHPQAAMVYGMTQYWYSWTGKLQDRSRDHIQPHHIRGDRLIEPPTLLELFLQSKAAVPCINSVLVRRQILKLTGQFEESFHDMYEDQVFYAKVTLRAPVFVSNDCWDKYRQHADSVCSTAARSRQTTFAHLNYVRWLRRYLREQNIKNRKLSLRIQKEVGYYQNPSRWEEFSRRLVRRSRKLVSRIAARPFPINRHD